MHRWIIGSIDVIVDMMVGLADTGYIAGTQDGIVSKGGVPCVCPLVLMDADTLTVLRYTQSLPNGHYLITGLDPNGRYLVMARDHEQEYEPFCWDWVVPMSDKTADELVELWQSWQT
ncbi:MAG: hypothetical protein Q3971_02145 [Moraxella sp.]|nr:hypothetical protein [Moraxella sp.]